MARLKAYCGPMFSGKSTLLANEIDRAKLARRWILSIKPATDTRTDGKISARTILPDGSTVMQKRFDAINIIDAEHFAQVLAQHRFDFLVADECQFFPSGAPPAAGEPTEFGWFARTIDTLLDERSNEDLTVIVAGLDLDFRRRPFGAMPELIALADEVVKTTGVCMNPKCRATNARFSHRLVASTEQNVVGDGDLYQVRCRFCHSYLLVLPPSA